MPQGHHPDNALSVVFAHRDCVQERGLLHIKEIAQQGRDLGGDDCALVEALLLDATRVVESVED